LDIQIKDNGRIWIIEEEQWVKEIGRSQGLVWDSDIESEHEK
jgi:hypothetical protein